MLSTRRQFLSQSINFSFCAALSVDLLMPAAADADWMDRYAGYLGDVMIDPTPAAYNRRWGKDERWRSSPTVRLFKNVRHRIRLSDVGPGDNPHFRLAADNAEPFPVTVSDNGDGYYLPEKFFYGDSRDEGAMLIYAGGVSGANHPFLLHFFAVSDSRTSVVLPREFLPFKPMP